MAWHGIGLSIDWIFLVGASHMGPHPQSFQLKCHIGFLLKKYSSYFTGVPFKRNFIRQIKRETSDFEICSVSTE